jgi:hypothetical protein
MTTKCNSKQSGPKPDETIDDWGGANILGVYTTLFRQGAAAAGLRPVRVEPDGPKTERYRLADVLKLAEAMKANGWTGCSDVLGPVPGDPSVMRYYGLQKHWSKRIVPHLGDAELNAILVRDFNKFTLTRFGQRFEAGMFPRDFDERFFLDGRAPRFCRYAAGGACHWLVNFALRLAILAQPQQPWRILTSWQHSTVWDGDRVLFDFVIQAIGESPAKCFSIARWKQLAPGELMELEEVDEAKNPKRAPAAPAGSIGYHGNEADEAEHEKAACA